MDGNTAHAIATRWVQKWSTPIALREDSDAPDLDSDVPEEHPMLCLEAILVVLTLIPADPADTRFQVLAASPLENLLVAHGPAMVEAIDVLARRDPAFRRLLNGVWMSSVDAAVTARLEKYRTAPW